MVRFAGGLFSRPDWTSHPSTSGIEIGEAKRNFPLTSYGGLELMRRYFQSIGLNRRIRQGLREHNLGGYGCVYLVVLVIGLLMVGARRLKQLRYVAHDPLFARPCGLARHSCGSDGGEVAGIIHLSLACGTGAVQ